LKHASSKENDFLVIPYHTVDTIEALPVEVEYVHANDSST